MALSKEALNYADSLSGQDSITTDSMSGQQSGVEKVKFTPKQVKKWKAWQEANQPAYALPPTSLPYPTAERTIGKASPIESMFLFHSGGKQWLILRDDTGQSCKAVDMSNPDRMEHISSRLFTRLSSKGVKANTARRLFTTYRRLSDLLKAVYRWRPPTTFSIHLLGWRLSG